jgi:GT2 family glycosyltransferase
MEVVLVDNGSIDGIAERVKREMPAVRVLEPMSNLGFAAGCNLGMAAVGGYDHVALVNNDATVEAGWLGPLVEALEGDPTLGAASSKMLIAGRFHEVRLSVPDAAGLGRADRRRLGVRVSAVRVDGRRVDGSLSSDEGFYAPEAPETRLGEEVAWWCGRRGTMRIEAGGAPLKEVGVRLTCFERRRVTLSTDVDRLDVIVDATPRWFTLTLAEPVAVINNAGSNLFAGGFGGDRGFLEADTGQFDEPAEVFAWCGGAVLLRRAYLDDVGRFDERLFLYYEDTDLSWRGRLHGWRYRYVPGSVVNHRHAASSGGVGSPVFQFHTERNRLLVLLKNAPWPVTLRALAVQARIVAEMVAIDVVRPVLTLHRPHLRRLRPKLRALWGVAQLAPAMLADRRRAGVTTEIRDALMVWETTKESLA